MPFKRAAVKNNARLSQFIRIAAVGLEDLHTSDNRCRLRSKSRPGWKLARFIGHASRGITQRMRAGATPFSVGPLSASCPKSRS